MTKLEICTIEEANPGQINLFPEGAFYKAYQQSAWLLCTRVHPFKVSARPVSTQKRTYLPILTSHLLIYIKSVKVSLSPAYCPSSFASNSSGREASNQIVFSS